MINDGHDLSLDHIRRSQAQPGSLHPAGSATALKKEISRILLSAINGSDKTMWTDDGRYIRWGLVEREIHKAIDGKNATCSAAARYEVKSLSSGDYYICLRDTDTPVAKILRGTLNEELLDLKRIFDGTMPPNEDFSNGAGEKG